MTSGPPFKPYLGQPSTYRGGKSAAGLHKLSSNENPWGPSPKVKEGLPWMIDNLHLYPPVQDSSLRMALHRSYDEVLSPECFITGNGASDILEIIMRGFLAPGDHCIYSSPAFIPYWDFSKKFGAIPIDVPLDPQNYQLDVVGILAAITDKCKLIFLSSPNNPTGTIIPKEDLTHYFTHVPDHVVTVLDEVYCHYVAQNERYSTALPFVKLGKQVIGLNSFSKAFGLAGLRVGYAYSTSVLATYIRSIKRPFALNSVSMAAAILALEDSSHLKIVKQKSLQAKQKLYQAFDDLNVKYWKSEANFILLQVKNSEEAADYFFSKGVIVRPVDAFKASNCIRISMGPDDAIDALLTAIRDRPNLFLS